MENLRRKNFGSSHQNMQDLTVRIIKENIDQALYNRHAVHPMQSWEWGEARKKMGIEVLRIGTYENQELKEIFQITFHKIPFTPYKIGYLPRSGFPPTDVLDFFTSYGKKNNVIFVKVEPYEESSKLPLKTKNVVKSRHPLFPEWTQMVDLTKSEEDLLKTMHQKTRYNIGLAQRKGVIVKEMSNREGFEIFIKLYFETCKRQHYFGHNRSYHWIIWQHLQHSIAHIMIAFYEQTPIAAFELFHFHDRFYYPYGGTSTLHRNTMASNLLMWESLKFAKRSGAARFDMWGSLPPNYSPHHPWAGFTKFKEGYGNKFLEFIGSYDLIINPILYGVYNILFEVRKRYLELKKIT